MVRRFLVALAAVILVGAFIVPDDAFAQRGQGRGGGGGGGGKNFSGGGSGARFIGGGGGRPSGIRVGTSSARIVGPSARIAGPAFHNGGALRVVRRGGHHRVIRRAGLGIGFPFVAAYPYAGYSYYDDGCVVPQQVLTPWGVQIQLVDVCSYPNGYVPY